MIITGSPSDILRQEVEHALMREGRAAYRLGWPISKCPPFKHPDHAWAWRQGWRNEQEKQTNESD